MIVLKTYSDLKTRQLVQRVRFENGQRLTIFGGLNFDARQMYELANFGIGVMQDRVLRSIGSDDTPMKPLTKNYAIRKTKKGLGNRRNLLDTGKMLSNISVRSISAQQARIDITSALERKKARANEVRSAWWGWSPRDLAQITAKAQELWRGNVKQIGFGSRRGPAFVSPWMDPKGLRVRSLPVAA